ncbi:hypothetical protein GWK47_035351 [Chionoecetes opilio]|uniref:Uncharacterized protein n=1 Tax=Chionoecetes opilio TaxID=41210 RepID=A0A8J5CNN0_CHIOP|nr:hypothetical protein GWK47_035351 [Chionoecetes opilio]
MQARVLLKHFKPGQPQVEKVFSVVPQQASHQGFPEATGNHPATCPHLPPTRGEQTWDERSVQTWRGGVKSPLCEDASSACLRANYPARSGGSLLQPLLRPKDCGWIR